MILTSKPLASVVFAVLFGGILIANQMGLWKTSGSKVPAQFTAGEFAARLTRRYSRIIYLWRY